METLRKILYASVFWTLVSEINATIYYFNHPLESNWRVFLSVNATQTFFSVVLLYYLFKTETISFKSRALKGIFHGVALLIFFSVLFQFV